MNDASSQDSQQRTFTFESLNMQVGLRLQIMTHRRTKPVPYFSTLIGYVKDDYIIVKVPTEHGVPIGLNEGERVTVRVFSGINVCSFACSVQRVFERPWHYMHLSFPTSIQGTSLRSAMRVKAGLKVQVRSTALPDAAPVECTMINVSVSGARFGASSPLSNDEELISLRFTLTVPGTQQDLDVDAVAIIRNMTVDRTGPEGANVYTYGVQFVDLDTLHYTLLQNLTYEALLADRMQIV